MPTMTTRSDVLEREYEKGTAILIRGIVLLVACAIGIWLFRLFGIHPLAVLCAFGVVGGAFVTFHGARKMNLARQAPSTTHTCPYCDFVMEFPTAPTTDFDCESCHRKVAFKDGEVVPVRSITCPACRAEHKVSILVKSYTCDSCNRVLRLEDPNAPGSVVAENTDLLRNYDVIITGAGRQATDVAMELQNLLVCNLIEARKQLEVLPLTVVRNVPERKADAIRRKLRELGATVVIRPSEQ